MKTCQECDWSEAFSGNHRVCGYLLQGGETVYIRRIDIKPDFCPIETLPNKRIHEDGQKDTRL